MQKSFAERLAEEKKAGSEENIFATSGLKWFEVV